MKKVVKKIVNLLKPVEWSKGYWVRKTREGEFGEADGLVVMQGDKVVFCAFSATLVADQLLRLIRRVVFFLNGFTMKSYSDEFSVDKVLVDEVQMYKIRWNVGRNLQRELYEIYVDLSKNFPCGSVPRSFLIVAAEHRMNLPTKRVVNLLSRSKNFLKQVELDGEHYIVSTEQGRSHYATA